MCDALLRVGESRGLRSLGSTGEFSMGVLTETKKTPRFILEGEYMLVSVLAGIAVYGLFSFCVGFHIQQSLFFSFSIWFIFTNMFH